MIQDNDREAMSDGDGDEGDGKEVSRRGSGFSRVQGEALQRLDNFHLISSRRIC